MGDLYYDKNYFDWQKSKGAFGGWANLIKFQDHIAANLNIVDYGCGGGFLLQQITCKDKIGIEINDEARKNCETLGIKTVKYTEEVPDEWADLIISNNTLEHTCEPLSELKKLFVKLKKGGKIVFVVPCESIKYSYKENDINYHLYSWSPMCIGNLFTEAGYKVLEAKPFIHKWPPNYEMLVKIFGKVLFHFLCKIYAHIETSWYQVRVVAER